MLQEDLQHPSESMKVKNKLEKLPFYIMASTRKKFTW
jgi:hypothetical protein